MNLHLDHNTVRHPEERRNLWSKNGVWWVNCLAIERFWFYGGQDLVVARGRRDALLSALDQGWPE